MEARMKKVFTRFVTYLLRGSIVIAPLAVTLYIIISLITGIDGILRPIAEHLGLNIPGLGIVIAILLIAFIGFISSLFLLRPMFQAFEQVITHTPFVKLIYTSIKDLISAFVGNNKKFSTVVLVNINGDPRFQRLGYLTESDMTHMGLKGKVAVYFPHSYAFSGNLFIVPAEDITILNVNASEVMKFIVSGGVTQLEGEDKKEGADTTTSI